jgi:integrase
MPLEVKRGSRWWYGRIEIAGIRTLVPLRIRIAGCRPASLREMGDASYERSRALAEAKLAGIEKEARDRSNDAAILSKLHRIKTGQSIELIPLSQVYDRYVTLLRKKPLSIRWAAQLKALADQFAAYCEARTPAIVEMAAVTTAVATEFVQTERLQGFAPKTANNRVGALSAMFEALGSRAGIIRNPFREIPFLDTETQTIHRRPYSFDSIKRIVAAVQGDDYIRPIVIVGMCTAMRRVDCCLLQHGAIDWTNRTIRVSPAKGGERVAIPIFPLLERELAPLMDHHGTKASDYVFPELAQMYRTNPDGVSWRVRKVLLRAGFAEDDECGETNALTVKRSTGKRRASVYGMHSFRTTWITLALLAGLPVELVRKVTGQRSADVVIRFYFNPEASTLRRALAEKLPFALTGCGATEGKPAPAATVTALLQAMTDENWRVLRDEAVKLMQQAT